MLHTLGVGLFSFICFFFLSDHLFSKYTVTNLTLTKERIAWSALFALSVMLMIG